ncbi:phosphotransferase [Streptomyces sp. NPDC006602]|uniref:phosphotransferase n=1 Tax=Streptomyces sp. NPDC006602 TaxID=3364751 RepID=UPI00368D0762
MEKLSPWAAHHFDDLVALEQYASLAGSTLLHGDLYPFNITLTADRVFVVDWPHAWVGPRHCDAVTLLASVSLSGVDPQPIAENHRLTRDLEPIQINETPPSSSGWSAGWRDLVSGCSCWSWAAVCGVDRLAGRFCR